MILPFIGTQSTQKLNLNCIWSFLEQEESNPVLGWAQISHTQDTKALVTL